MYLANWWELYGNATPTLQKLAMRILSQTASSSACERNWSTFALVHTKQRNRLAYKRLEKLVFCSYNMKLNMRDMKYKFENSMVPLDPLDMIERAFERSGAQNEGDDEMLHWIDPIHLDDENQNPDMHIAEEAENLGVDVNRVLNEHVRPPSPSHRETQDGSSSSDDTGHASDDNAGKIALII